MGTWKRSEPPAAGSDATAAVTRLLETHGGRIHALAARLCRHRADAEDVVQETFLQAFRKWHTFRGASDPGTWLYAIAVRAARRQIRRRKRLSRVGPRGPRITSLMPWGEETVMAIAAEPDAAESRGEREEAIARVQAEIARLPEHLRVPIVLKEVIGLSVEDAASTLGLAVNTVKTRLHRGRLALRKAMASRATPSPAPPPIFDRQVCLDLLKAKMEAMDRGGVAEGFAVPQAEVCARCRAVFRELDLVQDACAKLSSGTMPAELRRRVLGLIGDRDRSAAPARPRRGRRPVRGRSWPLRPAGRAPGPSRRRSRRT